MVALNFDRARPETLLNLNEVAELRGWSRENGTLRLGAGLTYAEAMRGPRRACPRSRRRRGPSARRRSGTAGRSAGTSGLHRPRAMRFRRCWWSAPTSRWRAFAVRGACRSPSSSSDRSGTRSGTDELIVAVHVDPSGQPQTFMKVGPRNAMVIAVCSLALVVDRERGELRAAFGSAGPVTGLVTRRSRGRGRIRRARR